MVHQFLKVIFFFFKDNLHLSTSNKILPHLQVKSLMQIQTMVCTHLRSTIRLADISETTSSNLGLDV